LAMCNSNSVCLRLDGASSGSCLGPSLIITRHGLWSVKPGTAPHSRSSNACELRTYQTVKVKQRQELKVQLDKNLRALNLVHQCINRCTPLIQSGHWAGVQRTSSQRAVKLQLADTAQRNASAGIGAWARLVPEHENRRGLMRQVRAKFTFELSRGRIHGRGRSIVPGLTDQRDGFEIFLGRRDHNQLKTADGGGM
jgi:hypothetical protein